MAVSEQTPVDSSTGNGVTTVFPYTFKIISAADLEVTVDGVVKTLTTHYTVSGAGNDAGGDVTFLIAPASGTAVIRRRHMSLTRTTDYQYQGDLPTDVLNDDQDAPILMIQQVQEEVDRSLKFPLGSTASATMPTPEELAGGSLAFDSSGNPIPGPALGDLTLNVAAAAASAAAALADRLLADADVVTTAADSLAAATSETNAAASAATSYGNVPIFTGTRPTATTAGVAAVASGQLFKARQQFGQAVDVWKDNAGTAQWMDQQPFGLGETAERVRAIEGATIESWVEACGVAPDILIDSLDMHTWDGRLLPNSMKLLSNPPNKNLVATATGGDLYFGTGGTPAVSAYTRRVTGTGGLATGMEWTFTGNNVNVDYIPILNNVTLDPSTYKVVVSLRSKATFGAQNIQWHESWGATTSIFAAADAPFADTVVFSWTVAARASGSLRLRSQVIGSAFQIDRVRIFEDEGNGVPAWSDDSAGQHVRNRSSARGLILNNGLFIDSRNSTMLPSLPLLADGLPLTVNDLTIFASVRLPNVASATTSHIVCSSAADGSSPVQHFIGVGNTSPAGPVTDGCIQATPTPLATHALCLKNEGFHVFGHSLSTETVIKGLDELEYWNHKRSGGVAFANNPSRMGILGNENAAGFKGDVCQIAIWINKGVSGAKPFTSAQIKAIQAKMKKHVTARGGTLASFRDILLSEGDSRNNWAGTDPNGPGWNFQMGAFEFFGAGTPSLKVPQVGWASSVLGTSSDAASSTFAADINYSGSTLWSRRAEVLALIEACHDLGLRIHFSWLNDINDTVRIPANATQYSTDEKVLMQIYRDALDAGGLGSRFNLFTCTPVHTNAGFEAGRATLNTLRRAYPGTLVHSLIDIAADATMGTYSGTTAPTGYVDNLHFNKAGALIVANLAKTAIAPYRLY